MLQKVFHGTLCSTKNAYFYNNNIDVNEELMLVILNCTLLHNQEDGWTCILVLVVSLLDLELIPVE